MTGAIVGSGWAVPPAMDQQELWDGFFAERYGDSRVARRAWTRAGVRTRHGVADPRDEDVSAWSTGARMRRFVNEAMPLGKAAISDCLAEAGLTPGDVDLLTVASCTGYATPGLDILLARDLGMPVDAQRLHVGHMGCYAALPALASTADAVAARGRQAVLLCVELTSLHAQPATDDPEQMVAHALFSDAAAAVAVTSGPGLELVDLIAHTDVARAEMMTWEVTDLGFRMRLSPRVPLVLREHVVAATDGLLRRHGLTRADVDTWAIHPGGPRILDVIADRLGLTEAQVTASRTVLRDHGNCSSATLLLILDLLRRQGLHRGEHVLAMAFGPGLTLYAALLRQR